MKHRAASFAALAAVYLAAGILGFAVYARLSGPWYLRLLGADTAATLLVFLFSLLFRNASVYDPYWSVQPIVILVAYACSAELTVLRVLLLTAVCFWGLRLTANWAYTFHGLSHQDWRYTMLREKTGAFYPVVNLIGIHMVPTVIVWLCILPAAYVFVHAAPFSPGSVVFFSLAVASAVWQGIADRQMHRFRREHTGGFLQSGLWKHSRHPNYLGEILMWWCIALCVLCVYPDKWYLCVGAAANTLLFLTVSIPMADRRQGRKPGFEAYREATRMLLPFRK